MSNPPDPAEATTIVESFVAAIKANDATAAEHFTIPFEDESITFSLDSFPPADELSIGEATVEGDAVIVPLDFVANGETEHLPAVCLQTADGPRIHLMRSASLAMGADMGEVMDSLGNSMESLAEGMAEAMGGLAEGMTDAMSQGFAALGGPDDEGDEDSTDIISAQDLVESQILPIFIDQFTLALGNAVGIDIDYAGTSDDTDVTVLASVGLGSLLAAVSALRADSQVGNTVPGAITRIHLEWDDDVDAVDLSAANGSLSCTVGSFLYEEPPNPLDMAAKLKVVLELV